MDKLEELYAIEQIKKLKARYFRAVDTKDKALMRSVFADDVVVDYRGSATDPKTGVNAVPGSTEAPIRGGDEAAAWIMIAVKDLVSVHHGCMPEIEILDENSAKAIWAMVDLLRMPEAAPAAEMVGWGHYEETYQRVAGEWKIKTLRLTRLRVDVTSHPA